MVIEAGLVYVIGIVLINSTTGVDRHSTKSLMWLFIMEGNMKKIIRIGNNDYSMQSSALTQFKYRDMTGRKLMQDINKIKDLREQNEDILAVLDDFLEILLQITYVMIVESDAKQVGSFEDFLKGIERLFDDVKWVDDVIDLAVTPISGGNQGNPQ